MSTTIEQLELEVQSSATSAVSGIDTLASSLGKLKSAVKGGVGLTAVAKQLTTLNTALNGVSGANADNLNKLAQGLQTLSSIGNLKLSPSVATQITNIGNAVKSLTGTDSSVLRDLASALTPLASIGKANLNSFISQLQRLPQAVQALNSVSIGSLSSQIRELISALTPLTQMGKNNLASFVNQLKKLPEAVAALQSVNIGALASQIQQLANAFAPLATQMQSIANGFSALPTRLQRLIQQTNKLSAANSKASMSYVNLAAKVGMAYVALGRIVRVVGSWIAKSNDYQESLNLFTVSMGKYANEAKAYAEKVSELMGIDPAEWLKQQGTFMNLATGFGVAAEKAALMSKNLTQLGYDMASFFNMSIEDAMQKLQSAVAGELEPVRRVGYDLSQAALKEIALDSDNYAGSMENVANAMSDTAMSSFALSEGIKVSYNDMTQAEKSQLRYIALMKQITTVQGDMARTLETPANQLRILKAQINQAARALGNIFIPMLNAVLPYAIALAKVIRLVADAIASLFGFVLTEIDYSGLDSVVDDSGKIEDNLGGAAGEAKKIKNALLGIDELNIISPLESSGGGSGAGAGGGGLDFELPTYDFIGDAVNSKVQEILEKMKEWLGLTEEINSWSDFFHTRLGRILTTVGAIAIGLAAWKISRGVISALETIKTLLKEGLGNALTLSIGISLTIGGIALEAAGIIDTIQNELNGMNFAQILGGGGLTIGGGALIGKGIAGAVGAALGSGIGAVVAGIPAMFVGIYDACVNGIDWLNAILIPAGSAAAGFGVTAILTAAGTAVAPGIGTLIGLVVGLVIDGVILVIQYWDEITAFLKKFFTVTVPNIWNNFTTWLKNIPKALGKFFSSLPGKISEWFSKMWQPIKDYDWNKLGYNIGQWFGNAWKDAVEFITVSIPNWFNKMWNGIKSAFKTFFTVTLPKFFTETIPSVVEKVGAFFKELPQKIYNAFVSAKNWIVDIGNAIIDGIWEGLQSIWKAITDFVDGFVQGFKDALGIHSPSTVFSAIGGDITAGLSEGIEESKDTSVTVSEWASQVVEFFTSGTDGKGIVENFKEIGGNIIGGFKDKISTTYTNVKTSVTTWASKVKEWFTNSSFGGINCESFATFANNTIEGFKTKVSTAYANVKTSITTWASKVKEWFTGTASYSSFYSIASDVINGFKNGIGNLYSTCKNTIKSWGSDIIDWFKGVLGINSPSKVFYEMAGFSVEGFNNGFSFLGKSTKGVVSSWADSFTAVTPTMSFAVDTSALKYYDSGSFAKSVSANVTSNTSVTATGFMEGMEEFYREYVEPTMAQMAADMRRQADKQEQTIVQIGNRTISDAVTTQQKANGFVFAK